MPAQSDKQAVAARIARAVQKGDVTAKPGSASASMAKMSPEKLKHFTHTEERIREIIRNIVKEVLAETDLTK